MQKNKNMLQLFMKRIDLYLKKIWDQIVALLRRFPMSKKYIDVIFQDRDVNDLAKWSTIALIFKVMSLPLSLATTLIISRWYGAESMGLYGLALSIIGIVLSIWTIGISTALPRLLGEARSSDPKQIWKIYISCVAIVLVSWIILWLLLYILSTYIAVDLFQDEALTFALQVIAIFVVPLLVRRINESFLLASKKVQPTEMISKILIPTSILAIVSASYRVRPTHYIPIWAYLLTWWVAMLLSSKIIRWVFDEYDYPVGLYGAKKILNISRPMLITGITLLFIQYTDILMIGHYMDTTSVWVYTVVLLLASLVGLIFHTLTPIISPILADMFWSGQRAKLHNTITISTRIIGIASGIIFVVLLIFGKFILSLYGVEFIHWYPSLLILWLAQIITCLNALNGVFLNISNKQKILSICYGIWVVINIILNIALIPRFGIVWWALASAISICIINFLASYYIYKHFAIRTFIS